jgi:hypothetical protein
MSYGFRRVHFGDLPAAPFLELTKKKMTRWKGYIDDGNGGGTDEMIDKIISEITEVYGQLYISRTVSQILETLSL